MDFRRLRESVLSSPGDTAPELRAAVEGGGDVPADLAALVGKVRLHAYKVTDDDIRALLDAGYSEDAVFEIAVAAAVGAGASRYDRAMEALSRAAG